MDLFEQMRQREEDKCKQQEIKVQELRKKLNNADNKFFDEDTKTGEEADTGVEYIVRKDLLIFRSNELKTVFTDQDDEIDNTPSSVPSSYPIGKDILKSIGFLKFSSLFSNYERATPA